MMCFRELAIERRQRLRTPAARRATRSSRSVQLREDDHVVAVPGAAGAVADRADRGDRAAAGRHTLQRAAGEKRDRAAPSGDQNGSLAPSVPAIALRRLPRRASRIQSWLRPVGSAATNASRRPSGDSASVSVRYMPSGGRMSAVQRQRAEAAADEGARRTSPAATAASTPAAAAAKTAAARPDAHTPRASTSRTLAQGRPVDCWGSPGQAAGLTRTVTPEAECGPDFPPLIMSRRCRSWRATSEMFCQRSFGSFARHA